MFDLADSVNWVIYDLQYYVDNSILLLKSLFLGNLQIVKDFLFHPLLGFYTTSMTSLIFSNFLDKYHAGLLSPIIFSSLMCLTVYLIGEKIGGFKMGLISWVIATLDPYSIEFSTAFLDMPAAFFSALLVYFLLRYSYSINVRRSMLIGIIAGLAISSKHIVIPLIGILLILFIKNIRLLLFSLLSLTFTYILANAVKFTSLEYIGLMFLSNVHGGGLGVPAIIYGPIEIGKLYTYPWYILTYLGLGYTGIGVAPYVIPLVALILFCYHRFSNNKVLFTDGYFYLVQWTALSLVPLILLPRNYWIPLSRFPGMNVESDVLTKFLYPYYYVITIPCFSVLAGYLFTRTVVKSSERSSYEITGVLMRSFEFITTVFMLLSPLALAANTIHPFWDFLFTLIINIEKEDIIPRVMGIQSMVTVIVLLVFVFFLAIVLNYRNYLFKLFKFSFLG
ncbi:MAG: glycosyltransferase family 39 protein [Nitrososphaerota archaeon]